MEEGYLDTVWKCSRGEGRVLKEKGRSLIIVLLLSYNIFFIFVFQEGRKHDSGMLADSGVYNELATNSFDPAGHPLCLYGDPAYPLRVHLQAPFKNAVLTPQMEDFNNSMSAVRSSVEWLFSDVINDFKFLDFKKNLKIGLSSVGKMYVVSALLRNAITCLYGNTTSSFFDLDPPNIYDYFS